MADKFDVSSRLAEGRPAVDNVQNYVWACQLLGYQNPDLTLHAEALEGLRHPQDGVVPGQIRHGPRVVPG